GQCLCSGINWIISFIQAVAQQPPDNCCDRIVASLGALNSNLLAVFNSLSAEEAAETPPDFSGIVAELQCICEAMQAAPAFWQARVLSLGNNRAAIAAGIPQPVDLTPIGDPLNVANDMNDIPEPLLSKIKEIAGFPPDLASMPRASRAS